MQDEERKSEKHKSNSTFSLVKIDPKNSWIVAAAQKNIPIVDYEGIKPYIDKVIKGEENVLWKNIWYNCFQPFLKLV